MLLLQALFGKGNFVLISMPEISLRGHIILPPSAGDFRFDIDKMDNPGWVESAEAIKDVNAAPRKETKENQEAISDQGKVTCAAIEGGVEVTVDVSGIQKDENHKWASSSSSAGDDPKPWIALAIDGCNLLSMKDDSELYVDGTQASKDTDHLLAEAYAQVREKEESSRGIIILWVDASSDGKTIELKTSKDGGSTYKVKVTLVKSNGEE